MKLPERLYYPLPEAAEKLGCTIKDLYHYAYIGALNVSVYVAENDGKKFNSLQCLFHNSFNDKKLIASPVGDGYLVLGDNFKISLTKHTAPLYKHALGKEYSHIRGYYVSSMSGFYYTPAHAFAGAELGGGQYIKLHHLRNTDHNNNSFFIYCDDEEGYEIDVNRLCVMAGDLNNIKSIGSFPEPSTTSPKTAAKRNEVIYSLIKLIPEMGDVDLDTESLPKIADLIDSIAASRGIEFPKTHWQTWQKYLGRESQQKRKK
ncbi:TPA: hypothetical protein ACHGA6_003547 [Escherichia coli]|nr:hypothetical protein [Escherichia coli]EII2948309.1 hypothetical protein [Escherichia coli]HAX3304246.1 hypothetical protein [Escherichia coli]HAX3313979.1 hypothetical protein [Escherichia coli]HCB8159765.1 hypothetical protein [Escherichia coli]